MVRVFSKKALVRVCKGFFTEGDIHFFIQSGFRDESALDFLNNQIKNISA